MCLSYKKSICFFGNVSPGWWESLDLSVVSCESVDSGFDQNESEFTIDISSEFLNMLSDVDGFLDKMVKIFWDGGGGTSNLQDSENLGSGDTLNLWDTVLISKNNTDLRWSLTSLGHLDNLGGQITCGNLNP